MKGLSRHPLIWLLAFYGIAAVTDQQILRDLPMTLHEYSIYTYGAKCDGSTNDSAAIVSAEAAAAAAGGGMVTGWGTCAISTALTFNDSRIVFAAKHHGDGDHDTGSNDNGWVLKWTGGAGATMMTISAVAGGSNQALYGNGMRGMTFDCNNSAAIGLELASVKGGTWDGLYFIECTTAGLDTVPVSSLGEAADVQGNRFNGIHTRIVLSTGIGIRARGTASANTSFDSFYASQLLYKNGVGIQLQNTDNLSFINTQMVRAAAGSGIGVELTGDSNGSSRSDFFYDLSPGAGGVTVRGTETITTAVQNVQFIGYDITNSPPAITTGTGVTGITVYKENGHMSGSGMINGLFGESDNNLTNAASACSTTDSACIYNTSQSGIQFLDGTGTWLLRQDSNHNLQLVRQAGSGLFTLSGTGLVYPQFTVSGLPTCNSGSKGYMVVVTDATAPTYNATFTGGGAVVVPAFCNGTSWVSH